MILSAWRWWYLSLLSNIVGRHIGLGTKGIMEECIYDMGKRDKGRIVIHGRCSFKILACDVSSDEIFDVA